MDAIEALRTRRSVRVFQARSVARDVVEELIDCGRLAPSANNIQPVEFVVVTEPGLRRRIALITDYGRFIADAPVCIVVLARAVKYYLEDGAAAVENILTAVRARGLGACWVAGDKKPYADEIRRMVGAPDDVKLVALLPLGHPAEAPAPPKRPLDQVLHWERFARQVGRP